MEGYLNNNNNNNNNNNIKEDTENETSDGQASGYLASNQKKVDRLIPKFNDKMNDSRYINMSTAEETTNTAEEERDCHVLHGITTQYVLKTGLNKFKEQGKAAITK